MPDARETIRWLKAIKEKYLFGGDEAFDEKGRQAIDHAIYRLEPPRYGEEQGMGIYQKAAARLARMGIKDPTSQIITLEAEIDCYRERIRVLQQLIEEISESSRVVHGRWLDNGMCNHKPSRFRNPDKWTIYMCSECGYSNGRKRNSNYCPNCGAKMDGRSEGE